MIYNKNFLENCKKLGNHIQELREKQNISIQEFAIKTNISTNYLQKIEQEKAYRVLIDRHLMKIVKELNVTMSELFRF